MNWLDEVNWDAQGLAPAIAQERGSGDVLMLAWMNRAALAETAATLAGIYDANNAAAGARRYG